MKMETKREPTIGSHFHTNRMEIDRAVRINNGSGEYVQSINVSMKRKNSNSYFFT